MPGEGQAVFGLRLGKKVDSEVVGVGDERVGAGPAFDGDGDERRVDAQGEEGGRGEAVRARCIRRPGPLAPSGGDDGDRGGAAVDDLNLGVEHAVEGHELLAHGAGTVPAGQPGGLELRGR